MGAAPPINFTQEDRLLEIDTTLALDVLLLEKFSGSEILSKPFEFRVTMLSTKKDIDIKSLLRTSVTVSLKLIDGTSKRYFNAVFHSIMQGQEDSDVSSGEQTGVAHPEKELACYEAILVPKLWFLSLNSDCKIFQNMSVPDIVTKVLNDANVTDFQFQTYGTYTAREYCVQYRESSLAFISRLLEEEGIFYFFSHQQTKHTIIFVDKNTTGGAVPAQAIAKYSYDQDGWVSPTEEGVAKLERIETAFTGKATLTDYDFTKPKTSLLGSTGSQNEEVFDYPGEYTEVDDSTRYSRIRLEERESVQFIVNGASRCRAFRPGYFFTLQDHYRKDTNGDYFLTSVSHDAMVPTYRSKGGSERYENLFTAIPKAKQYRPPRETPRPVVKGLQPALVVGKAGEEIWVDQYGRVIVQFYWDRVGQKNESSSCWVRVSQIWAGKNWGWMTIPRIGQEVLVDFLEGDPDRPIIVGRVYNADQMPPWTLPANQTQSGILTRSSQGGDATTANYLQFEDKKDSEQINIWAQKDMNTTVENNDTQTVQVDRTITVKGKHTETITGDTTITIQTGNHSTTVQTGNQSITVSKGNQTTTISMGNQSTTISMGNQTTTVSAGSITTEAMQAITMTVGPSSISITPEGVTIEAPMVTINGDAMVTVEADGMLTLTGGITMINC